MTQDNWTANGVGDWATNGDWSLGSPPTSAQDAYIGTGSGGTVGSSADETVASIGVAANYVLDINSNSTFAATAGTGPNAIVGRITIDGSTFKVGSTIANDGVIQFLGTNSNQAKMEVSSNLTIASVGGRILLQGSDPASDFIVSDGNAATLDLNGGTLSGGGTVGDANLTVNIAQGTLVDADGQTLILNTLSNTIINAGTMETTNGGVLEIDSPVDNTNGMIVASAGTVLINGVVSNGSGVVTLGLGGTLDLLGRGSIIGNVSLTGVDTELLLGRGGSQISGAVIGAAGADYIDFQGVPFVSGVHVLWQQNGNTGTLSLVNNGSTLDTLTLAGQYATSEFRVMMDDDRTGTVVEVLNPPPNAGTTADMILHEGINGVFDLYDIGGNTILGAYPLGQVGPDWLVAGLGDFTGTDTADVILRNSGSGNFEIYDVSNNNFTDARPFGAVGLNWQIAGFGEFNGDGTTDMLLRDSATGTFEVYDISNNQITGAAFMGTVGLNWQFSGIGNFSGAGESDMLLRNSNTGGLEVYDIANNQITGAAFIGNIGVDWQFSGVGNFSSVPGETDLLLRNANTGGLEVYDINNNQLTGAAFLGTVGVDWQFAGIAAANGAGTSDLVLRNVNSGAFEVYDIADNQLTGAASLGSVGLDWLVGGFAADPPTGSMGSSDGSTSQLVQAMAGFGGGSGTGESLSTAPLSAETSPQTLLTTPQHA